ncbi:transcriptional regulator with XRE-family HTH domain [Anaerotaenia torta]
MDTNRIGKQIMTLRKERGYTQENLAEFLNISPQAVSKWENGVSHS